MARNNPSDGVGRLFRHPSGQDELFDKSYEEELQARHGEPVECLGLTFENDEARRTHFLGRLRQGLEELHGKLGGVPYAGLDDAMARLSGIEHWPMGDETQIHRLAEGMRHADASKDLLQRWKDEVGFPHGEIEDILNLSDPPYHTACPNPFLGAFVEACGKPYAPDKPYRRKPFAVDVSEGKTHPIYRAHGYHTKVPHLAIVPSILHYTEPGDLVLDGFAGTGMTGVAAQWCGMAPESYRKSLGALWAKEGFGKPNWGFRRTIQNDLSPLAGFIAANYGLPFDLDAFAEAGRTLLDEVEHELGWMYETLHTDGKTNGRIDYTVWSEVFSCPECAGEVLFLEEALDRMTGRVRDTFRWVTVPADLQQLRDKGLELLQRLPAGDRTLVHWCMCMAVYPFFGSVADATGRLLRLQGTTAAAQVQRRIREQLGERETVARAARRVLPAFIDWGVLLETNEKGIYRGAPKHAVHDLALCVWTIEAILFAKDRTPQPVPDLVRGPHLFPFDVVPPPVRGLETCGEFEVTRYGLNNEVLLGLSRTIPNRETRYTARSGTLRN